MKKYIATMIVIIVLLAALVYFIGVKTNPGGMFMIVPNGPVIQVQSGDRFKSTLCPYSNPMRRSSTPETFREISIASAGVVNGGVDEAGKE